MDIEAFVSQVLADQYPPLPGSLPDEAADALVERLKAEADRHWRIDAHVSLRCADVIVHVGQTLENSRIVALGLMARGDALKLLNQTEEAWETLERAGALYLSVGDEVGWARTRIGRLGICVNLNRVDIAMQEAEQAREIFLRHGEQEKLLRLILNMAAAYDLLGDYQQTLSFYQVASDLVESLGEAGQSRLGMLYINMGYAHQGVSNLHEALTYYERAHAILQERREPSGIAVAELNIATVVQAQGQYRKALQLLHRAEELLIAQYPMEAAAAQRAMVECYLSLNRYQEARDLATNFIAQYSEISTKYDLGRFLVFLANAEAGLKNFDESYVALNEAEKIFCELQAERWIADIHFRRGCIALKQGDFDSALHEASEAAEFFKSADQQGDYAAAILLIGQVELLLNNITFALNAGKTVLQTAKQCNIPSLRYHAHLLLGKVAERQFRKLRAIRHYQVATSTIERVQRGLTITVRSGFLEDKQEALQSLIGIYLEEQQTILAFQAIERTKSQLWMSYLVNREQLRWTHDDPYTQPLIEELNRLRKEHHWYYRVAHDQIYREVQRVHISTSEAANEVAIREQRMRVLTEILYLNSESDEGKESRPKVLEEVQASLGDSHLILEFYSDGEHVWIFSFDKNTFRTLLLPTSGDKIVRLVEQLQANVSRSLRVGLETQPARSLAGQAQQILNRLYFALIAPLADRIAGYERLVIIPYGVLHYLPFHLLHDGAKYLIETHEVVMLPAAGLATQKSPQRKAGALVLAHSWDGRLPNTVVEAELVSRRLSGLLCCDEETKQSVFATTPSQVLHIAAHGQHRIDQPDFSYIQLTDGQLLTDDLLQYDLSYELVTLSACETGRANVTTGDELIGLGRGFLYAGAGALVASLWRVDDAVTVRWMDKFYSALQAGHSKAAALRFASLTILSEEPELHPAFWGAFQLIGNADPLSTFATH